MSSLIELKGSLRSASTQDEIKKISLEIASFLENNNKTLARFLYPIISSKLPARIGSEYAKIAKGDFFQKRVELYTDVDDFTKIAIGISYLQDFEDVTDGMDDKVIQELLAILKEENLHFLINDVSVNFLQSRNGEIKNILDYEG